MGILSRLCDSQLGICWYPFFDHDIVKEQGYAVLLLAQCLCIRLCWMSDEAVLGDLAIDEPKDCHDVPHHLCHQSGNVPRIDSLLTVNLCHVYHHARDCGVHGLERWHEDCAGHHVVRDWRDTGLALCCGSRSTFHCRRASCSINDQRCGQHVSKNSRRNCPIADRSGGCSLRSQHGEG